MVESRGYSLQEYSRKVKDLSARYRKVSGKARLSEIDKYVVISQILGVRLDEIFVITKE